MECFDKLAIKTLKSSWYQPIYFYRAINSLCLVYILDTSRQRDVIATTALIAKRVYRKLQKLTTKILKRNKEQTVSIWRREPVLWASESLEGSAPHVTISPPIASALPSYWPSDDTWQLTQSLIGRIGRTIILSFVVQLVLWQVRLISDKILTDGN